MSQASTVESLTKEPGYIMLNCVYKEKNEYYPVSVRTEDGDLSHAYFECTWDQQQCFHPHVNIADKLSLYTKETVHENDISERFPVSNLLSQLQKVGWDKLESIDLANENLKLKLLDSHGRKHFLEIDLSEKLPENMVKVDLPIAANFEKRKKEDIRIQDLLHKFEELLTRCEDFWNVMSEIDNNTRVLEPEHPTPSTTHRRIVVDSIASLIITVNADRPRSFPDCIFLGPEEEISPLKDKLNKNLEKWNDGLSLLDNFIVVLEQPFPSKQESMDEDVANDCGICYSSRINGQLPNKVCENKICRQAFHHACLYEWLKGLPSSRLSFNTIFGECPFCSKAMAVKINTS